MLLIHLNQVPTTTSVLAERLSVVLLIALFQSDNDDVNCSDGLLPAASSYSVNFARYQISNDEDYCSSSAL